MINKTQAARLRGLLARHAETAKQMGYDMGRNRNRSRSTDEHQKSREAVYAFIRELEGKQNGSTDQAAASAERSIDPPCAGAHAGPED